MSARSMALQTLLALAHGQYGNLAVDAALKRCDLSEADKHLYTALVYGVTERQVTLDFLIGKLSSRPVDELDETVRTALRLGLYQLIYLDRVPDHAAINETVSLVSRKAGGFVNAVLRSYLRLEASLAQGGQPLPRENTLATPAEWADRFPELAGDPVRAASVAYGFPESLTRVFRTEMGFDEARADKVMAAFCRRPAVSLRVNPLRATEEDVLSALRAAGFDAVPGNYAPHAIRVPEGAVASLPAHAEGKFFIQDEASQLCVAALDARPGMLVMDVCACPGSKSFGAALDMGNEGIVRAYDLHESKLSLIASGAARLGIDVIRTEARDARKPDASLMGQADRVLCDVPCSGLGVLAKKPEIRHKDLSESARLPGIQAAILEASAGYVKRGGVLVYSTCTLLEAENRCVVEDFLSRHGEFEPYDFTFEARAEGLSPIRSENGMAVLVPDGNGTDGFFIARMRRKVD